MSPTRQLIRIVGWGIVYCGVIRMGYTSEVCLNFRCREGNFDATYSVEENSVSLPMNSKGFIECGRRLSSWCALNWT